MAQSLSDFVLNMAKNPETTHLFKEDPHSVMTVAGLSPQDMSAILSGDPGQIQKAVLGGFAIGEDPHIVIVVVLA